VLEGPLITHPDPKHERSIPASISYAANGTTSSFSISWPNSLGRRRRSPAYSGLNRVTRAFKVLFRCRWLEGQSRREPESWNITNCNRRGFAARPRSADPSMRGILRRSDCDWTSYFTLMVFYPPQQTNQPEDDRIRPTVGKVALEERGELRVRPDQVTGSGTGRRHRPEDRQRCLRRRG